MTTSMAREFLRSTLGATPIDFNIHGRYTVGEYFLPDPLAQVEGPEFRIFTAQYPGSVKMRYLARVLFVRIALRADTGGDVGRESRRIRIMEASQYTGGYIAAVVTELSARTHGVFTTVTEGYVASIIVLNDERGAVSGLK